MGSIISIINHNNNSGKTFISFNIASALAIYGKKTLYLTGVYNKKGSSFIEKYTTDKKTTELNINREIKIQSSKINNLDFLRKDFSYVDYEIEKNRQEISEFKKQLKSEYDFIIADPQSGITGDIEAFLLLADKHIIPFETNSISFDSLAPLLSKIEWAKKDGKITSDFIGFLVNNADFNSRLSSIFKKQSFYLFCSQCMKQVIPGFNFSGKESIENTTLIDDIFSTSGKAFLNLAETLIEQG